jgi:threonine 3-dehydrogenase
MPLTALAPHFAGDGSITFVEREYPDPGVGELLLRVEANAICGSDRGQYYNGSDVVPGHEAVGTVVEAGVGTTVDVGTRGAVFLMDYCGECRSCRSGFTNQCTAKRADMGFSRDGGYGPYEIVHESNFFAVSPDLSAVEATLLLDVMGTSGHALGRAGLIRHDIESVYIAGAGPIGLGLLVMAKLVVGNDVPIHISDVTPWRFEFAERLGGLPVDASRRSARAELSDIDVAFDSTGRQLARRTALDVLGRRGVLVCVGHGEGLTVDVSADLISPEHAVLGSEYFRFDEMSTNLALLLAHRQELSRIVTHTRPVAEIGEAFDLFLSGRTGKVVVTQAES